MIRKIDQWPYWLRLVSFAVVQLLFNDLFGFSRLITAWQITPAVAIILYKCLALVVILGLNWVFLRQQLFFGRPSKGLTWSWLAIWILLAWLAVQGGRLNRLPAAIIIGLLAAVTEEIMFRGIIFGSLRVQTSGRLARTRSVVLSALLFGGFHITNATLQGIKATLAQMIFAFGAGLLLAVLYQRHGTLLAPMALHFTLDYWATLGSSSRDAFSVVSTYHQGDFVASLVQMTVLAAIALLFAIVGRQSHRDRLAPELTVATRLNFKVTD